VRHQADEKCPQFLTRWSSEKLSGKIAW
jgi:hypothetical protein